MSAQIPNYLEGPNFIPLQQYDDGTVGVLETGPIDKIEDCVDHIDDAIGFVMIEGGKSVDVSSKVAELWWAQNRDDCDTMFDVPEYIHEHYRDAYDDIAASRYEAHCQRAHERAGWGGRL